jgi:polyketide cyclase/dehydrase/lipid transport protein
MSAIPEATVFTRAPLRHRLRVELHAPVSDVWAVTGNHERLSEYSEGIARVEISADRRARVCYFQPPPGAADGMVLRELIRWEVDNVGYATSAEPDNMFGLVDDLSIVTIAATADGALVTWEQHYNHADLPALRASFDDGLADIGRRLVHRFGGRVIERFVDGPMSGPLAAAE